MPTKSGKKNFKDYTGIKFSDLILPMLAGGVGSYSPAAGRGINLGLQAFRTLQAGREYQDEKDLGKYVVEDAEKNVARLEEEREAIMARGGMDVEDKSEVSHAGYYGEGGMAMPDPQKFSEIMSAKAKEPSVFNPTPGKAAEMPEVTDDYELSPDAFSAVAQQGKFSMMPGAEGELSPEMLGDVAAQQTTIPAAAEEYANSILTQKQLMTDSAKRLGFIDRQVRLYEQLAALGHVNPSSAGYLGAMNNLQRESDKASLEQLWETHALYSRGRKEQAEIDKVQIIEKHNNAMALEEKRQILDRYVPFNVGDGEIISYDKKTDTISSKTTGPMTNGQIKAMPYNKKFAILKEASSQLTNLYRAVQEAQITLDDPRIAEFKNIVSTMYTSMTAEELATPDPETGLPLNIPKPPPNQEEIMAGLMISGG